MSPSAKCLTMEGRRHLSVIARMRIESFQRLSGHRTTACHSRVRAEPKPAAFPRGDLRDLLRELLLDGVDVERPKHVTQLFVFGHDVTEPRVESRDQLKRLRHFFFHPQIDL